jgi:predicted TIM-barrel fold metal-dependent hydrolase
MRAYNDAIAEFCSEDRSRLKGMAMLNIDDPHEAVAELTRCREMGLAGALITVLPTSDRSYDHPMYEPLWSAAEDLAAPLALHVATGRAAMSVDATQQDVQHVSPTAFFLQDHFVRKSLGEMIFAGVFERHPRLRVGSVEHEVSWIPFFCDQMDYTYTDRPVRGDWHRFADPDARPSHYFREHVFVSFQEDRLGVKLRHEVGLTNLMWGSDYPHTESTFPRSREIAADFLAGVPEDEQRLIVRDNAADLFGFDVR